MPYIKHTYEDLKNSLLVLKKYPYFEESRRGFVQNLSSAFNNGEITINQKNELLTEIRILLELSE